MKLIFIYLVFAISLLSCQSQPLRPEPHLELGQKIFFVGGIPDSDYVLIGYRDQLESNTEDTWNEQNYLVFVYMNKDEELKQGVIHRNAILKK